MKKTMALNSTNLVGWEYDGGVHLYNTYLGRDLFLTFQDVSSIAATGVHPGGADLFLTNDEAKLMVQFTARQLTAERYIGGVR